jgi:hypothetical protein
MAGHAVVGQAALALIPQQGPALLIAACLAIRGLLLRLRPGLA